jgi:Cys-rich repeat protein
VRGRGILGSCARVCNASYLPLLINWAGLIPKCPALWGRGQQVSQQTTNRTFDDLARALAEGSISRRRALKLFAGTAIAALIPSRALAQQQKVTICHKPGTPDEETIEVSNSAVNSHLRHGDQLGPCVMCLPNGTCAKPCTTGTDCPGCPAFCVSSTSGADFCAASVTSDQCLVDSDCPQGQFCRIGTPGLDRFCVIAC